MNNYKIRVKTDAESKQAQELFFALGYGWTSDHKQQVYTSQDAIKEGYSSDYQIAFIYADDDGCLLHDDNDQSALVTYVDSTAAKELTISTLQDLVVLHRNNVHDATHCDNQQKFIYLTSDQIIYYWDGEWLYSAINKSNDYENYITNSLTVISKDQEITTEYKCT